MLIVRNILKGKKGETMPLTAPVSIQKEHEELHLEMAEIRHLGGKTAQALERLVDTMADHFVFEEEVAMPPLALLSDLTHTKENNQTKHKQAIKLSDKLVAHYDGMLSAHRKICKAAQDLAEVGMAEKHPTVVSFAEKLQNHARMEEEVLYPASILVGKYLKERQTVVT